MGTNRSWNCRLTVLKQSRWRWSDHRMTNFKMTVRADCVFCMYPPSSAKSSYPLIEGSWPWTWDLFQLLFDSPKISKLLFPPTLAFIGFRAVSTEDPTSGYSFWHPMWGCCVLAVFGFSRFPGEVITGHGNMPGADDTYRDECLKSFLFD